MEFILPEVWAALDVHPTASGHLEVNSSSLPCPIPWVTRTHQGLTLICHLPSLLVVSEEQSTWKEGQREGESLLLRQPGRAACSGPRGSLPSVSPHCASESLLLIYQLSSGLVPGSSRCQEPSRDTAESWTAYLQSVRLEGLAARDAVIVRTNLRAEFHGDTAATGALITLAATVRRLHVKHSSHWQHLPTDQKMMAIVCSCFVLYILDLQP